MIAWKINGKTVSKARFAKAAPKGRLDDMLRSRRSPGLRTDTEFMRNSHNDPGEVTDAEYNAAKAAGIQVEGRRHFSSLGEPMDPDTWQNSLTDVKRVAKEKGLNLYRHGERIVEAPETEKASGEYRVADHLVEKETQVRIAEDPSLQDITPHERTELSEDVRKDITPVEPVKSEGSLIDEID